MFRKCQRLAIIASISEILSRDGIAHLLLALPRFGKGLGMGKIWLLPPRQACAQLLPNIGLV